MEIDLKAPNQLLYPYEVSVSHNSIDEWELTSLELISRSVKHHNSVDETVSPSSKDSQLLCLHYGASLIDWGQFHIWMDCSIPR